MFGGGSRSLPGPGGQGSSPNGSFMATLTSICGCGGAAKGLRQRRMIIQLTAVVAALLTVGVWYQGAASQATWREWGLHSAGSSEEVYDAISLTPIEGSESAIPSPVSPGHQDSNNHPNRPDTTPPTPIQTWGAKLQSGMLLGGLEWPERPPHTDDQMPLSSLGWDADDSYNLGTLNMTTYMMHLTTFANWAFPPQLASTLVDQLRDNLGVNSQTLPTAWDANKRIWQTDKDDAQVNSYMVSAWREGSASGEGWKWRLLTDQQANEYVKEKLAGSVMERLWDLLPNGILHSDMLRYLVLLLDGGIYSDTDTKLLKPPSSWGQNPQLWRGGEGWLSEEEKARIASGESIDSVIGRPSVVVGVEADVGTREDWHDWWARPVQIVQWTMASAQYHPITLSALLRILHSTVKAIDWAHEHEKIIGILNDSGRYADAKALREATVVNDPKHGGPLGIMDWTGPGVWTDAVLQYLRVKYGVTWLELRWLREPRRIGDVVVLPVTGFSPGVGNFGAKSVWDGQAMVEHAFKGSWKEAGL